VRELVSARGTIDSVIPVIDPADSLVAQKQKAHPYNLTTAIVDGVGWPLGMAFFSTSTIIPAFLLQLHAGYLAMSLVPSVLSLGYLIPGLFVAGRISRMPYCRSYLFWVGICERIPLFLIAAAVYFISSAHENLLFLALYGLLIVHSVALGFNQPAYWSIIDKGIPLKIRGRTFGVAGLIGGILALGVDPSVRFMLDRGDGLRGYAGCFLVGAVIICVTFLPFGWFRESKLDISSLPPDQSPLVFVRRVWRSDRSFRRLVWAQVGASMWTCAPPLFLACIQERLHAGVVLAPVCATIAAVCGALGNLAWGAWADKRGNRIVLIWAGATLSAGAALIFFADTPLLFELIFALTALGSGGIAIAGGNALLEITPSQSQTPAYLSTMNAVMAIPRAIAPLIGGVVAIKIGLTPVFVIAMVSALFSVLSAFQMKDPRIDAVQLEK
jgi:MFS family permease